MQQENIGLKLLEAQVISPESLQKAQLQVKTGGGNILGALIKLGAIKEDDLSKFLAELYGVPAVDLSNFTPDPSVVKLIPGDVANKFQVVPVSRTGRRLTVAMVNPSNIFALDDIKFITGCEVQPCVASESAIKKAIDKAYDSAASFETVMRGMEDEIEVIEEAVDDTPDVALLGEAEQAPVVKLVNSLISDAVRKGASDIHIEPYERTLRVRFRIDGTLYEMMSPPFRMKAAIISRLKIMADLDIAERRVPQDGRIKLRLLGRSIDLRVSSLPTIYGEKVVMRILDPSSAMLGIDSLGYEPFQRDIYQKYLAKPQGMILVTGPTGSGKTVSLYTGLNILNRQDTNISTAEDPAEINLPGVNQVNVNNKVGLTFAAALRAFLRQDPDVVMVGEIRDLETAEIAIKAAQTGHLVLSTLHTNDAPQTLTRLIDMGVKPYAIATSVSLIIAQRLARRLCTQCKALVDVPAEALLKEGFQEADVKAGIKIYAPKGCSNCTDGYKGRCGIYQVMPVTDSIGRIIMEGGNAIDIGDQAKKEGVWDLRRAGLEKVRAGMTSIDEVNSVTIE